MNGAMCEDGVYEAKCFCSNGWTGDTCEGTDDHKRYHTEILTTAKDITLKYLSVPFGAVYTS